MVVWLVGLKESNMNSMSLNFFLTRHTMAKANNLRLLMQNGSIKEIATGGCGLLYMYLLYQGLLCFGPCCSNLLAQF